MIPENLKNMFGLKDGKDLSMANNIWKMLDEMSQSDPESYKKFVEKNINEGFTDMKSQKQKKEKPFKIIPKEGICLEMDLVLNQKVLTQTPSINEKVDLNQLKWYQVKSKFKNKVRVFLNLTSSERVKEVTIKSSSNAKQFKIAHLKDIQSLYYSLQGPLEEKIQKKDIWYYCMIFNDQFYQEFDKVQGGKQIFLSLAVSYFQERLTNDKNPLLKHYSPEMYGKLAFYAVEKPTISISQNKFKYGKQKQPCQFLLERQVDKKERADKKKEEKKEVMVPKKEEEKPVIKIREQEKKVEDQPLPELIPTDKNKKKPLIEVIEEKTIQQDKSIPYQMKETQDGYKFQFLVHNVNSINDIDLEVSKDTLKLGVKDKKLQIKLKRVIDDDKVKAKHKKKIHKLLIDLYFV